jgi:hypothetical protein
MSKVDINTVYLVNKLPHSVIMKGGYINIPAGGYVKVREADLEHDDVLYAMNRDWVEAHTEVPDTSDLPKPATLVIEHDQYRGMTEDELQGLVAAPEQSGARSEALGRSEQQVEKTSEATSEAIGRSAEEVNGVAKKGRKAAVTE